MKHSVDRILTTHVGSLPRPADLHAMSVARREGEKIDEAAFNARVRDAVSDIVRKQVELSGGSLSLQSSEGKGSTFHFTLPAPQCAQEQH